jgi:polyisoprenoid-binding protein YceI
MSKYPVLFAMAGVLALGSPSKPTATSGSWQVDARHSDAQLITDATTDYGKTQIDVTLGFGRVSGRINIDNDDLTKSWFDFRLYPATGMTPDITEDGKFLTEWLTDLSNNTLVCFHSKGATRTSDGKLQTTGILAVTRVDRNVDATPSEAYSGPVYGPPIIHRVTHEATFVFDLAPAKGNGGKDGEIVAAGSTRTFREDFPQLVKTVVSTYWPPVVQDKKCQNPDFGGGQAYSGPQCTGTLIEAPGLPAAPHAAGGQDVGISQHFNALVGNRLTVTVHLRLTPDTSSEQAAM